MFYITFKELQSIHYKFTKEKDIVYKIKKKLINMPTYPPDSGLVKKLYGGHKKSEFISKRAQEVL